MKYLEGIRKVIDYIEDNLKNEIMAEEISKIAGYSMYHFHRIFQTYLKETISEYVRRRRLTNAALDMLHTEKRVLDIALEYQFESHESFNRAFKKMFHTTPSLFRKNNQRVLIREKQRITEDRILSLHGGMVMNPVIVKKDEIKVIGLTCSTTISDSKIPAVWEQLFTRMNDIPNRISPCYMLGVSEFTTNHLQEEFTYMACVPVIHIDEIPEGMVGRTIPSREYVMVTNKGALDKLGYTFEYIYTNWLPKSGYELAEEDDLEFYGDRFRGPNDELSEIDIYIPIQIKSE